MLRGKHTGKSVNNTVFLLTVDGWTISISNGVRGETSRRSLFLIVVASLMLSFPSQITSPNSRHPLTFLFFFTDLVMILLLATICLLLLPATRAWLFYIFVWFIFLIKILYRLSNLIFYWLRLLLRVFLKNFSSQTFSVKFSVNIVYYVSCPMRCNIEKKDEKGRGKIMKCVLTETDEVVQRSDRNNGLQTDVGQTHVKRSQCLKAHPGKTWGKQKQNNFFPENTLLIFLF